MKQLITILGLFFAVYSFGQSQCTANFGYEIDSVNSTITFQDQSWSYDSLSGQTMATSWVWTIEGQTFATSTVSYDYTTLPIYVCLTASFDNGCYADFCDTVMLTVADPCQGFYADVDFYQVDPSACDGELNASVYGGTAPYSYSWTGSTMTTATITGLCEGNYSVVVLDANGCEANSEGYVFSDTTGGGSQVIDSLYNPAIDTCIDFTVTDAYVSGIVLIDSNTVEVEWTFIGSGVTQTITETYTFGGMYGSYNVSITIDCNGNKAMQTWGELIVIDENTTTGIEIIEAINNLKVYPNPVVNVLNVEFTTTDNNPINIQVISYTGQIISSINYNVHTGNNSVTINTNELNSGVYFVRINSNTIKFIK